MPLFRPVRPVPAFRRILLLDAVATGATGLLLVAGAAAIANRLGVSAALLTGAGWSFLGFGLLVGWAARRETTPLAAFAGIVAYNALFVIESVGAVAIGLVAPSPLGTAAILGLAAIVAAFAILEARGLLRSAAIVPA